MEAIEKRGHLSFHLPCSNPIQPKWPYIDLMRKFTNAKNEVKCSSLCFDKKKVLRPTELFPTGSKYKGQWNHLGMNGKGKYTFPNGVIYEGEFEDGLFHGHGELKYPGGEVIKGKFRHGLVVERMLMFPGGLYYGEEEWVYCKMPDRRFTNEYLNGIQPAGQSNLTAEQPPRKIPKGFYDTGDGFYDPKTKTVYSEDLSTMIRSLSVQEQIWIEENCRTDLPKPGPRSEIYEKWLEVEEEQHSTSTKSLVASDDSVSLGAWSIDTRNFHYSSPHLAS